MKTFAAFLAVASSVWFARSDCKTQLVQDLSQDASAVTEDAVVVSSSVYTSSVNFQLKFTLKDGQSNFTLRIDNLHSHTSSAIKLQLSQENNLQTDNDNNSKVLLTLLTRNINRELHTFASDPRTQTQTLRLLSNDNSNITTVNKLFYDVKLVLTPHLTECAESDSFKCNSSGECVARSLVNDGFSNCCDASDEDGDSDSGDKFTQSLNPGFYVFFALFALVLLCLLYCAVSFFFQPCRSSCKRNLNLPSTAVAATAHSRYCNTVSQTVPFTFTLSAQNNDDCTTCSSPPPTYEEAILIHSAQCPDYSDCISSPSPLLHTVS